MNLPRVEFEADKELIQGDLLGFVTVPFDFPPLSAGQIRGTVVSEVTYNDKTGYNGGYIEKPTNVFAMVGCDDCTIRRILYHKCRYVR